MTTYQYGVNDADGRAYIWGNNPITAMFYYETTGEPWHAPTPGDGFYGIGRDGRFYDNGSPTGPTLNGTSFGTLLGGFNRKTWMTDQEPLAINSWSTDKMNMALISDDHVRHSSLVPITEYYPWMRYLTSRQKWFLVGDFDVQVEFENRSVSSGSSGNTPMFRVYVDENNWTYIRKDYNDTYGSNTMTDGGWHSYGSVSRIDSSGKLRIVRTGNVFNNYYWDGSSWVLLHTSYENAVLGLPVLAEILVGGYGGLVITSVDTFGFTINSGTTVNTAGWAREAAGTHRGSRADFPAKALIIATEAEVSIIDIENDKLWWRALSYSQSSLPFLGGGGTKVNKVFMKNGKLHVSLINGPGDDGILIVFDFTLDSIHSQNQTKGQIFRANNGVYPSPTKLSARDVSPHGIIRNRNYIMYYDGAGYWGNLPNFQLLTSMVYAQASCQNGSKHYWATGCDTGISVHSYKQGYYDGVAATGNNWGAPQYVKHNFSARVVATVFRRDTNELFYCTTTTVYSISLANLEAALVADPNGGSFTADSSAALPGTRSVASQDALVAHGGYVFVPRDEGIYRISWPSGTSELFYGNESSAATHKVLPHWGKARSVSLTVNAGPTYLLVVGFETGVGAIDLTTHLPYTTASATNLLTVQA